MPEIALASIVEGHAETYSVGVLVRRLYPTVRVLPPLRVPRQRVTKAGELERAVELAARKLAGRGGILVLLDAETDCPAELGPALLERARRKRGNVPSRVVLAKREFEAWFIAAIESLRDFRGVPPTASSPADPESVAGAKGWISKLIGRRYYEVSDQPAFAAKFDMELAKRKSSSFAKMVRDLEVLVGNA